MEKCVIGDRVQLVDYDTSGVKDGVVTNVIAPKKPKPSDYWNSTDEERLEWTTFVDVKWDDGTESQQDMKDLQAEDSEMERDFRKAYHYANELIQAKVDEASAALREAVKIAERYGVPFRSHVSPLSNQYYPSSLENKFNGIDREFVQKVTDTYNEYDGWEHSAVC